MTKKQLKKKGIQYSEALVDRIAEKMMEGVSLVQITSYSWSPAYPTLMKWQAHNEYAKRKWREARTTGLEDRNREKLIELRHTDWGEVAKKCDELELSPQLKTKVFDAYVRDAGLHRDELKQELAWENPKKYGSKITQDVTLTEEVKHKSYPELQAALSHLATDPRMKEILAQMLPAPAIKDMSKVFDQEQEGEQ